jgi:serine/threonine-protein kinase
MAVAPGFRLGPYEIVSLLGVGGMGEVWRATDTNLKRDVAVKVLPVSLASDPERLARFRREAEVLAALSHSNIAHIHGLETFDGSIALVMELVEGHTLAERIAQGAIATDEALPIAKQIAEALEAAHGRGIVHRDLKPANIRITPDGTVKVLDFGLAKAASPGTVSRIGVSQSPTLTSPALVTGAGMILGTAAYMSPEQARGKPVDKGTDIWAFGVVLWEMVTGRLPFAGETVTDTLAAVVKEEPAWHAVPPPLLPILTLCLQKEPRQRLRDMGDVLVLLQHNLVFPTSTAAHPGLSRPSSLWRRAIPVVATAVTTTAIAGGGAWWARSSQAPDALVHLAVAHPAPEIVGGNDFDTNVAISPDGRSVAYVAAASSVNSNVLRLYLRSLERGEPVVLSDAARSPFFSADGQWVGFVEENQRLSKVRVTGGAPVSIGGRANAPRGISWGDDDTIVYATADFGTGLMSIPAAGGDVTVMTTADPSKGELDHVFPDVLPEGKGVLFTITSSRGPENSQIALLRAGTYRVLIQGGTHPRYVAPGYVVYGLAGSLRAVAFDLDRGEIVGTPVPVLDGVQSRPSGAVAFGIARNGTLAYVDRGAAQEERTLVWVDRQGRESALEVEAGHYDSFALSPDGANLALTRRSPGGLFDIWVWSGERLTLSRLTFEPGGHEGPLWTPDGASIVYTTCRSGCGLYRRKADGTGMPEPLLNAGDTPQRTQGVC